MHFDSLLKILLFGVTNFDFLLKMLIFEVMDFRFLSHDPFVPCPWAVLYCLFIIIFDNAFPKDLGPRKRATRRLLAGYLRILVVCRDPKSGRQTLAGSSETILGRAGADLKPTRSELEPTWSQLEPTWANLSQLNASLEHTWSIFLPT